MASAQAAVTDRFGEGSEEATKINCSLLRFGDEPRQVRTEFVRTRSGQSVIRIQETLEVGPDAGVQMELFVQGSLTDVVAVEALIDNVEKVVFVVGKLR